MQSVDLVQVYTDNLRGVWNRSTLAEKRHGRHWYGIARQQCGEIASEHSFPLSRVVFAVAALSNQIDWEQNIDLGYHVAFCVNNGMTPRGHYRVLLDKAVAILRDGDMDQLRGPKVVPFAACILQGMTGSGHACIDRWMWRATGEPDAKRASGSPVKLRAAQVALRRVARAVRKPVSEVQAVIWLTIRNDAERLNA